MGLFLMLLLGCGTHVGPRAAASDAPRTRLLWSVEKDGAVSTFMGTCHLPIPLEDRLGDELSLLTGARLAVTELDDRELEPMRVMPLLWDRESSLTGLIGREMFASLARQLPEVPAPMLEHLPAWAAFSYLEVKEVQQPGTGTGADGQALPVLDSAVIDTARKAGVELRPVETVEQQFAMMNALPYDFDRQPSKADIAASERASRLVNQLCYQGIEEDLDSLMGPSEFTVELLHKRNLAWFPVLEPELAEGGVFVAVGAMHMYGETGLIAQAEAAGYQVTPVPGSLPELPVPDGRKDPKGEAALEAPLMPLERRSLLSLTTAQALCKNPEEMFRGCFLPESQACIDRMTTDLALCLDQLPEPEAQADGSHIQQQYLALSQCGLAGLIADAMVSGFPDAPACDPIEQALKNL